MKIAIFSESSADHAAMQVFLRALTKKSVEPVPAAQVRKSWSSLRAFLSVEFKHCYYRTDATALVAFADSDDTPPHAGELGATCQDTNCRYCQLQRIVGEVQRELRPIPSRGPISAAIGLAVPCIEAWLQCGKDPHCTEAAFARMLQSGNKLTAVRRELKTKVYGTESPDLATETRRMVEEANRLCQSAESISNLETHFPGFKLLAQAVRAW
jgi:hypothetical protein